MSLIETFRDVLARDQAGARAPAVAQSASVPESLDRMFIISAATIEIMAGRRDNKTAREIAIASIEAIEALGFEIVRKAGT